MADQQPMSDDEVFGSGPGAQKPLSDNEVFGSQAVDMHDPVNAAAFQQSPTSRIVGASQGNWFTRPFTAGAIAVKNATVGQGPLGLSEDTVADLQKHGWLDDFNSSHFSFRNDVLGAVLAPVAVAADTAQRGINAVVSGISAVGGGFINELPAGVKGGYGHEEPEAVARDAQEFASNLYIAGGVSEAGISTVPREAEPTLREAMTMPKVTKEGVEMPLPPTLKTPVDNPAIDVKSGNLNLDYIKADDSVKDILAKSAQAYADKEGVVISHAQTVEAAEKHFETARQELADGIPESMAGYMRADPVNRVSDYVARKTMVQLGTDEIAKAKQAIATGSPADVTAAVDAAMRTDKATGIVSEMGAEMGRTQNARQIPVGAEGADLEAAMHKLSETNMTPEERIRLMASFDDPQNVAKFIGDVKKPSWADLGIFYIISNFLSGPITHGAYAMAGELQTVIRVGLETPAAALYGAVQRKMGLVLEPGEIRALRAEQETIAGRLAEADSLQGRPLPAAESAAMEKRLREVSEKLHNGVTVMPAEVVGRLYGVGQGHVEGLRAAMRALKTGEMQMLPGEIEKAKQAAKDAADAAVEDGKSAEEAKKIGDAAYNRSAVQIRNPIVERAQFMKNPYFKGLTEGYGKLVGVPPRVASAIHTFQKFSGYFESVNALAYRQAASEGLTNMGDLAARVAQIKANLPDRIIKQAAEEGKYASLVNKPGAFGQRVEELAHVNSWTRFLMPFSRIANNINSQTILERSPGGLAVAGISRVLGMESEVHKNLTGQNGLANQANAFARLSVGTSIIGIGAWLRAQGITNGPADPDPEVNARSYMEGRPPDTVRIGDNCCGLRYFGLAGRLVSYGGAVHDVWNRPGHIDKKWSVSGYVTYVVGQEALREGALDGLANFLDAVNSHNPELSNRYLDNAIASAFIPFSVGLNQINRQTDPLMRMTMPDEKTSRLTKVIESRTPGWSETLIPQVDLFGRPMTRGGDYEGMLNDPVMQNLRALDFYPAKVPSSFGKVHLTEQQYFDYATKAGALYYQNALKMINTPGWGELEPSSKINMLRKANKEARADARGYMCMAYPDVSKACARYISQISTSDAGDQ